MAKKQLKRFQETSKSAKIMYFKYRALASWYLLVALLLAHGWWDEAWLAGKHMAVQVQRRNMIPCKDTTAAQLSGKTLAHTHISTMAHKDIKDKK